MKALTFILLLIPFTLQASLVGLTGYPGKSHITKLQNMDIDKLEISPDYYTPGSLIGLPTENETRDLNKLSQFNLSLLITTTTFPSDKAAERINKLGTHVELKMQVNRCITSKRNADKFKKISRLAQIKFRCYSNDSAKKAKVFAQDIMNSNSNLKINVLRIL